MYKTKVEDPIWQAYRDNINFMEKIIRKTIKCRWRLNEYVDNFHIALSLLEITEILEFDMIYQPKLTSINKISEFYSSRRILNEFKPFIFPGYDPKLINTRFSRSIAELYQEYRKKDNYYRNIYKLFGIHNEREWNVYKQSNSTAAKKLEKVIRRAMKKAKENA